MGKFDAKVLAKVFSLVIPYLVMHIEFTIRNL